MATNTMSFWLLAEANLLHKTAAANADTVNVIHTLLYYYYYYLTYLTLIRIVYHIPSHPEMSFVFIKCKINLGFHYPVIS